MRRPRLAAALWLLLSVSAFAAPLRTATLEPRLSPQVPGVEAAAAPVPLAAALEPAALAPLPEAAASVMQAANALPVIRVYFAREPGFGHQSATLAAARRLRELGYEGRLEAVFDNSGADLPGKLAALLPGFQPEDVRRQTIPSLGMTVESHVTLERRAAPRVPLAITGGDDWGSHGRFDRLRADTYLRLSPNGWASGDKVYRGEKVAAEEVAGPTRVLYTPSGPDAAREALGTLESAAAEKAQGLRTLLDALPANNLWPVYGLAFMSEDELHDAALGVVLAQQRNPELFGGRGVVAPLLLDSRRKVDQVFHMADERLEGRLRRASIDDPNLLFELNGLKLGELLFLETGPVPPAVFEHLFAKATVPPTLEGKNAAALAGLLGIPFLPVRPNATTDVLSEAIERDPMRAGEAARLLSARHPDGSAEGLFSLLADTGADEIARFVAEAMRPGSPLRRLFADLRQRPDDYGRDKLLQGLKAALSR